MVFKWVGRIIDGRPPHFHDEVGYFARKDAVAQLEKWCCHESGSSGGQHDHMYGKEALETSFKACKAKRGKVHNQLQIEVHLIPGERVRTFAALVKQLFETTIASLTTATAKSVKASKDTEVDEAIVLFQP